jgi:hypothetical protein
MNMSVPGNENNSMAILQKNGLLQYVLAACRQAAQKFVFGTKQCTLTAMDFIASSQPEEMPDMQ